MWKSCPFVHNWVLFFFVCISYLTCLYVSSFIFCKYRFVISSCLVMKHEVFIRIWITNVVESVLRLLTAAVVVAALKQEDELSLSQSHCTSLCSIQTRRVFITLPKNYTLLIYYTLCIRPFFLYWLWIPWILVTCCSLSLTWGGFSRPTKGRTSFCYARNFFLTVRSVFKRFLLG